MGRSSWQHHRPRYPTDIHCFMYFGFNLVLYLRLRLFTDNSKFLRGVLWTIITTGIICNVPSILNVCMPSPLRNSLVFLSFIRIQNCIHFARECPFKSVYISFFYQFAPGESVEARDKGTLSLLIIPQIVIPFSDVATTVLIYTLFYVLRMGTGPLHVCHQAQTRVRRAESVGRTQRISEFG